MIEVNNKKCVKMKYKIGDAVRTTKDRDINGCKLFSVGTVGEITDFDEKDIHPYVVKAGDDYWNYSEDMLEPFKTYEQGLEDGRNDAWEFIRKTDMAKRPSEAMEMFDFFEVKGYREIFEKYTPQEALAKLKAYEESQSKIEVGDVVVLDGTFHTYVVTAIQIDRGEKWYCGISQYGRWFAQKDVTKTGKHIDITSILEQISEV